MQCFASDFAPIGCMHHDRTLHRINVQARIARFAHPAARRLRAFAGSSMKPFETYGESFGFMNSCCMFHRLSTTSSGSSDRYMSISVSLYSTHTLSTFCLVSDAAAGTYRFSPRFSILCRASHCITCCYISPKNLRLDFKNKNPKIFAARKTGVR